MGEARAGSAVKCAESAAHRAEKTRLIAKESRLPADRARHPWLARFALQAGLFCPLGDGAEFCRLRLWERAVN
ncbi:hypothetical protein CKF43_10735 [Pantoea graminicola]|nr:hypothetical protein CKF43_10735 [Pantoea sp. ARC607]